MPAQEVLIIGAGPTGLAAAIEMKRMGIPFRLVEKSLQPAQHSQALVVQARTLEQFERYEIAEAALQKGRPLKHASMISEGKTIVSFPFDKIPGNYPFVLFLPQNETEALLINHLEALGGTIERGVELLAIVNNSDEVAALLVCPDGKLEYTSARWAIACDGAHSTVRQRLGIPFTGSSSGLNFFLADLQLEGPDLLGDELRVYLHRGDVIFIGRLNETLCRVIVALNEEQRSEQCESERELNLCDFQNAIDRAGIRLRAVSSEWMTTFHVSDRRAGHIRHQNVFLAGDASHIHSPVAGQGMNTGIQDTANLAWKIAAVRAGADSRLLDSYQHERGQVSERLLRNTSRVLEAATQKNPILEKIRDLVISTMSGIPLVQEQIVGFVSETAIHYRDSPAVIEAGGDGSIRAGDRMPNPELVSRDRTLRLLDRLKSTGDRHLIIGADGPSSRLVQERLPQAESFFVDLAQISQDSQEFSRLLGKPGEFVVIRPDGYVGFHGTVNDLERLDEYAKWMALDHPALSSSPKRVA